jgi:hypothetical protein
MRRPTLTLGAAVAPLMDTLNFLSLAVGIAGLIGTSYFGLKSVYLQRKLRLIATKVISILFGIFFLVEGILIIARIVN